MITVRSVQVGMPREHGTPDRPWFTGYFKAPVSGAVRARKDHMEGDGQAGRPGHGGADRAVLAYSLGHYDHWRLEFPDFAFPIGAFGENLTIDGADEQTVCIGEVHAIGTAVLQVSIPRAPCGAISRRCSIPTLLERVRETGRIGWLYRVLQEGEVSAGDAVRIADRPHPAWTVERGFRTMEALKRGVTWAVEEALEFASLAELGADWRKRILVLASSVPKGP